MRMDEKNQKKCKLSINDLRLWIHLGCGLEEQFNLQQVSVDIEFLFPTPPIAIETDDLSDTVCYLKVVERIQATLKQKFYHLIEHVTGSIHNDIQTELNNSKHAGINFTVTVRKVSPPVPGIHGGVTFSYSS